MPAKAFAGHVLRQGNARGERQRECGMRSVEPRRRALGDGVESRGEIVPAVTFEIEHDAVRPKAAVEIERRFDGVACGRRHLFGNCADEAEDGLRLHGPIDADGGLTFRRGGNERSPPARQFGGLRAFGHLASYGAKVDGMDGAPLFPAADDRVARGRVPSGGLPTGSEAQAIGIGGAIVGQRNRGAEAGRCATAGRSVPLRVESRCPEIGRYRGREASGAGELFVEVQAALR
ncbi:MAG: hypothetical protein B7Z43_07420 [Sphingomonas sp. 12-62-6]|nr:MAG: hypothetical protein B7Z43_07420 [Sphingomonas sp. 12-62-6]